MGKSISILLHTIIIKKNTAYILFFLCHKVIIVKIIIKSSSLHWKAAFENGP